MARRLNPNSDAHGGAFGSPSAHSGAFGWSFRRAVKPLGGNSQRLDDFPSWTVAAKADIKTDDAEVFGSALVYFEQLDCFASIVCADAQADSKINVSWPSPMLMRSHSKRHPLRRSGVHKPMQLIRTTKI